MKKFIKYFVVAIFALFSVGGSIHIKAAEQKKVMTTFYPVYYLAQQIAGDKMEVSMLLDGGQGAHDYESTAKDIVKVQETDLFIYQDDEMEFFVSDLLKSLDLEKTSVLESTNGIDLLAGSGHDHGHEAEDDHDHEHEAESDHDHGHEAEDDHDHEHEAESDHEHEYEGEEGHHHEFDPHTWLDPLVYAQQAANVRDAMIEIDPDNKETYERNAQNLIDELTKLDEEYKTTLKDLSKRTIVVQHAAFGYLANAYGLEQVAITGLNTTKEPSAKVIAEMQEFMKTQGNKIIFVDPSITSEVSETVANATGAELLPLRTLEVVSQEEMKAGADYLSLMRENLKQLVNNQ